MNATSKKNQIISRKPNSVNQGDKTTDYLENFICSQNQEENLWDFLVKSGKQIVLGKYTDDATWLGIAGSVGAGLIGIDLPMDIRDGWYDLTHPEECEWYDYLIDLIAFAPIIGTIKNAKYLDEAGEVLDAVHDANKAVDAADGVFDAVRRTLHINPRTLQHEFKHAKDYGIFGNWNTANRDAFEQAIRDQINSVDNPIIGTYRTTKDVVHFYNPETGLDTMVDLNGNFVAG